MPDTGAKPSSLRVLPESVPQFLRDTPRWVLWAYDLAVRANGRQVWAKVPKKRSGAKASSTVPATWCSFDQAQRAWAAAGDRFEGLGLVIDGSDGLVGVDLDDCVTQDPLDGTYELNDFARDAVATLPGYWELSPSGTGVKGFLRVPADTVTSQKDNGLGVEVYAHGRYFTVTGHVLSDRTAEPEAVLSVLEPWLASVFAESLVKPAAGGAAPWDASGDEALDAFMELNSTRQPVPGWDAERIARELAPHLDLDCTYDEWIRVGQALHHQFDGSDEGFELWDSIYALGSKYNGPEYGAERWRSFHTSRGRADVVTLGSLLKATREVREGEAARSAVTDHLDAVRAITASRDLETYARQTIARDRRLNDADRALLVGAVQAQSVTLAAAAGVQGRSGAVPVGTVRQWLRAGGPVVFPDVSPATGSPLATVENVQALCDALGVVVRYNVISKEAEIIIPGTEYSLDNAATSPITQLISLSNKYGLPSQLVPEYIGLLSDLNQYNPVLTWIESKGWDGRDRIGDLADTLRSPMDPALKRTLLTHWLVSAVTAVAEPDGVMARGVLVLQGPQYQGKTRWLQSLAPESLGVVAQGVTLDTKDKDSVKQALSHWLVELGELDGTMRRSDMAALKAFITRQRDTFRRPYARTESHYARRTVFFASVNDEHYLNDPTGSTRFWNIPVDSIDVAHQVDAQQLWAQVLAQYRAGAVHYPTTETMKAIERDNEDFQVVDPLVETIQQGLPWDDPLADWQWVSATELLRMVGWARLDVGSARIAARAAAALNGGQKRRLGDKSRVRQVLVPVPGEGVL